MYGSGEERRFILIATTHQIAVCCCMVLVQGTCTGTDGWMVDGSTCTCTGKYLYRTNKSDTFLFY